MLRLSAFVSLFFLALFQSHTLASPCLSFDADFNLLALGFGDKDWNVGTQDVWSSGTPSSIPLPSENYRN